MCLLRVDVCFFVVSSLFSLVGLDKCVLRSGLSSFYHKMNRLSAGFIEPAVFLQLFVSPAHRVWRVICSVVLRHFVRRFFFLVKSHGYPWVSVRLGSGAGATLC